jgi:fructose-1,6-bisphosphatase
LKRFAVMVTYENVGYVIVEAEDGFDARQKVLDMHEYEIHERVPTWDGWEIEVSDNVDEVK